LVVSSFLQGYLLIVGRKKLVNKNDSVKRLKSKKEDYTYQFC